MLSGAPGRGPFEPTTTDVQSGYSGGVVQMQQQEAVRSVERLWDESEVVVCSLLVDRFGLVVRCGS